MTAPKKTNTPDDAQIPFEDKKGMFGTSPINKELTDEEVEFLTSRTAPRVTLTRSLRKISLYISLFLILWFIARLVYHRTIPVTGMDVPPVFGLGEIGLTITCLLLSAANFFLISPEDKSIQLLVRFLGTGVPLILLGLLYLLPAERIHSLTFFMF